MSEIIYTYEISVEDYLMLRKAVCFQDISERQAKAALDNDDFLIAAKDDNKTVGMTRLVTDGAWAVLIVDVIVLPEYQGRGIGRAMIERALRHIKNIINNDEQAGVFLVAAKDKEGFYEKLGFTKRPDEIYGAGMSMWLSKQS